MVNVVLDYDLSQEDYDKVMLVFGTVDNLKLVVYEMVKARMMTAKIEAIRKAGEERTAQEINDYIVSQQN